MIRTIISGGVDGYVNLWTWSKDEQEYSRTKHKLTREISATKYADNNSFFVAGAGNVWKFNFRHFDTTNPISPVRKRLGAHGECSVFGMDYCPKLKLCCTGGHDSRLVIWSRNFWASEEEIEKENDHHAFKHRSRVWGVKILTTPQNLVASSSVNGDLLLHDLEKMSTHTSRKNYHNGYILSLDYDERNTILFSSGGDGKVTMFDVRAQKVTKRFDTPYDTYSVMYLERTNDLVTGEFSSGCIGVYDLRNVSQPKKRWKGHEDSVRRLVRLPDQNCFSSCSGSREIRVWSLENYDMKHDMAEERDVYALSYMVSGNVHHIQQARQDLNERIEFVLKSSHSIYGEKTGSEIGYDVVKITWAQKQKISIFKVLFFLCY